MKKILNVILLVFLMFTIVSCKEEIVLTIDSYKKEMLDRLSEFVSINSIYDESTVSDKHPFGKGVSDSLEYFYNLAKSDGFEVTNYDNYCVEIEYG